MCAGVAALLSDKIQQIDFISLSGLVICPAAVLYIYQCILVIIMQSVRLVLVTCADCLVFQLFSDSEKANEYWKRYINFDNSAIVGKYETASQAKP